MKKAVKKFFKRVKKALGVGKYSRKNIDSDEKVALLFEESSRCDFNACDVSSCRLVSEDPQDCDVSLDGVEALETWSSQPVVPEAEGTSPSCEMCKGEAELILLHKSVCEDPFCFCDREDESKAKCMACWCRDASPLPDCGDFTCTDEDCVLCGLDLPEIGGKFHNVFPSC